MTSPVLAFLVVTLCAVAGVTNGQLTAHEQALIVDLHNAARDAEPASNMQTMTYDTELELEAQSWVEDCHFAHQQGQSWGENLAAATSRSNVSSVITQMFNSWVAEKQYNTGGTFEECCSMAGYQCCHYTQAIWAKSTKIGCGLKLCPTMTNPYGSSMRNALYLACYYSPRGNYPAATCTWEDGQPNCVYDWRPYLS